MPNSKHAPCEAQTSDLQAHITLSTVVDGELRCAILPVCDATFDVLFNTLITVDTIPYVTTKSVKL